MLTNHSKYILGTLLTFVLLFVACTEEKTQDYQIKGKLSNVEGDSFYAVLEKENSLSKDTIHINELGEFAFTGHVDTLTVMSFYFNHNTSNFYLLVDKGDKIEIKGDVLFPDLVSIKGGQINNDLTAFKEKNKVLFEQQAELTYNLSLENDSVIDRSKSLAELKNIDFELMNIAAKYVSENRNKIASVMLINTFFKNENTIPRLDENLDLLILEARYFPLTGKLRNYSKKVKLSAKGVMAPAFSLENTKGKRVKLYDFRGKHVLLSFVSTTCDMCNLERKPAVELYNKIKKSKEYRNKIEFITILLESEDLKLPKAAIDSMKWNVLPDDGGWASNTVDLYNVHELPYNILISPTGTIVERNVSIFTVPELLGLDFDKKKKK